MSFIAASLICICNCSIPDTTPKRNPIISDVFEAVASRFGLGYFSSEKLSTTWLTQALSAVDAWSEYRSGESSITAYNALYKSVRAVSAYVGVSFSGVMREAVDLWNNTAGAYDLTLKIRTWDLSRSDLAGSALDAIIDGNDRQVDSIIKEFPDEDSYRSAMRSAIKEKYTAGKIDYDTAMDYLIEHTKLEELTREVRKHNGFAERMPVLENKVENLHDEIKTLKGYHQPNN